MNLAIYEQREQIEQVWRHIEATARPPYALSWGWVENWLASLERVPPLQVVRDHDGEPIAAAFGDMPVLRSPAFPALGVAAPEFRVVVDREIATPHVDLETVRAVEGGYLSTRPAVMRAHLQHTRKRLGELEIEVATDGARAHAMFDDLLALDGSFDNDLLRRLIDQRAPRGEIQLVRIRFREAIAAYFYSVLYHDRIAYQRAAFAPDAHPDLCHAAAIEHAAARGLAFYELHPDDARLATGESRQLVLRLQRGDASRLAV
jgi:Acetyltransferase (GNAT) domain